MSPTPNGLSSCPTSACCPRTPARLLLIDDSPNLILKQVHRVLDEDGHEIDAALTGEDGVRQQQFAVECRQRCGRLEHIDMKQLRRQAVVTRARYRIQQRIRLRPPGRPDWPEITPRVETP